MSKKTTFDIEGKEPREGLCLWIDETDLIQIATVPAF